MVGGGSIRDPLHVRARDGRLLSVASSGGHAHNGINQLVTPHPGLARRHDPHILLGSRLAGSLDLVGVNDRGTEPDPVPRPHTAAQCGVTPAVLSSRSIQAAATPHARLAIVLAAVHAARHGQIRALQLSDIDLANRRLAIAGRSRPLDDLTLGLLTEWLDYRRSHWPGTANPHLLISRCSGADPLHIKAVFGMDDSTAIRYATGARQLLSGQGPGGTSSHPGPPPGAFSSQP